MLRFLGLALQSLRQLVGEDFVYQGAFLDEDAVDPALRGVLKQNSEVPDAEPTIGVEGFLECLDVAFAVCEIPQGFTNTSSRFGCQMSDEFDDLVGYPDSHSSSSADSPANVSFPARCRSMAFLASEFASNSIVSTIASMRSRDTRNATVRSRRRIPIVSPDSVRRSSPGSWLCASETEYVSAMSKVRSPAATYRQGRHVATGSHEAPDKPPNPAAGGCCRLPPGSPRVYRARR